MGEVDKEGASAPHPPIAIRSVGKPCKAPLLVQERPRGKGRVVGSTSNRAPANAQTRGGWLAVPAAPPTPQSGAVWPRRGEFTSPGTGEITSPDNGEFTSPECGEFTSPSSGEITSPECGEFTSPNGSEFTSPECGEFTSPNAGEFTSPSSGEIASPDGGVKPPLR